MWLAGLGDGEPGVCARMLLLGDQEGHRPFAAARWLYSLHAHEGVKKPLLVILTLNCLQDVGGLIRTWHTSSRHLN